MTVNYDVKSIRAWLSLPSYIVATSPCTLQIPLGTANILMILKYKDLTAILAGFSRPPAKCLTGLNVDRKAKAQFEKFCAPLLNLAGLSVSIVQTDAEGQARGLMEVMADTDAVAIAGGDGTLSEVSLPKWKDAPICRGRISSFSKFDFQLN